VLLLVDLWGRRVLAIVQVGFSLLSEEVWSDFTQTDTSVMAYNAVPERRRVVD